MCDSFSVSDLAKQSGISQLLQVVRDGGLTQTGLCDEFRNADGATPVLGELGQESQAGWVGEHFEKLGVMVSFFDTEQARAEGAARRWCCDS